MPNPLHLILFLIGAVAMRGAGSTFNDLVDRDLDLKVERTRGRPLASRRIGARSALVFLVAQALVGLAVLLCFNAFTIGLGIAALLPVAVYPFMKRITSWPQAMLGLAFAWGALVGWSGSFASLSWPPVALYAGAILWTMGYDTIYALQDVVDDAIVGIGSTALQFGTHVRLGVGILYGLALVACAAALWGIGAGIFAWVGWAGLGLHLARQVTRIAAGRPPAGACPVSLEPRCGADFVRRPCAAGLRGGRRRVRAAFPRCDSCDKPSSPLACGGTRKPPRGFSCQGLRDECGCGDERQSFDRPAIQWHGKRQGGARGR